MKKTQVEKTGQKLQFRFPLIGQYVRLSAVKKLTDFGTADTISYLVEALKSFDSKVVEASLKTLCSLKNKDAIDTLCQGIITGKWDEVRSLVLSADYEPKPIGMRCMFFVITGQVEKYLELDFEFQYLRPEYQAASDDIQQKVRNAIQQSKDHRLMGLFGEVRKKIVAKDLTQKEAQLMLDIYARNKQSEEIFALLFFAPLPVIVNAIDALSQAKWKPYGDERVILLENLVNTRKTMGNKPETFPEPEVALGPVFQKWIETGRKEYASKLEQQLREHINIGTPAEAVTALSALATNKWFRPDDHNKFINHPHWMVRIAYVAIGDIKPDILFSENPVSIEGGEYWIKNMVPSLLSKALLQLKPVSLTPDSLNLLVEGIENAGESANTIKNLASILVLLSGYILRNTIVIGSYEKQIEDTLIGIDT